MKQVDFDKEQLYRHCEGLIDEKIKAAVQAIAHAEDASKDDTKSSAGDKFETTREMMQQEVARNQQQLLAAKRLKYQLESILPIAHSETAQLGSLIVTDSEVFFIAVALGKVNVGKASCVVISPVSPLGKLLLGQRAGATVAFNQNSYHIRHIY